MSYAALTLGAIMAAIFAIRAKRLLASAIWLALLSAIVSVLFYILGAPQVAVIELSVGAGLVTVLFVFAIAISGGEAEGGRAPVPTSVAVVFGAAMMFMLAWLVLPIEDPASVVEGTTFMQMLWEGRALDVMLQIAVFFSGVVSVLGLLGENVAPAASGKGRGA
ncbi:MAG: NADH-quinone oxidoreductase subunit J [Anaerolineales bacterium]|nr:NADH-quinone oxidoreductase subunit J [Anaerolineales bacterium]